MRERINALNLASPRPDPFSTFEFYENFLANPQLFPARARLRLLLAFQGDELVGYLALKLCVHRILGLRAARLDLLAAHHGDRPQAVVRPDLAAPVREAMYAYLLDRNTEWSLLEFQQQDASSTLLPPPPDSALRAFRLHQWPTMANATIPIRWRSIAGYFGALSKKARSNVSRQLRTLLAAGDVQFVSSADTQALAPLFELYRGVEARSWKGQSTANIGRDARSLAYFQGLMGAAQPMRVGIQLLLLDGVPIAGLVTGAFGKGLHALHTVFDERAARLAPGSALLLMNMRMAIDGGFDHVNLMRGFAYYKERWLAQMSETRSLQVYRVGTPYHWRRVVGDLKRRCFGRRAADPADRTAHANPARLGIRRAPPATSMAAWSSLATPPERQRYAALLAQARLGRAEWLSATQLAAAMPFATSRISAIPAGLPSHAQPGPSREPLTAPGAAPQSCA